MERTNSSWMLDSTSEWHDSSSKDVPATKRMRIDNDIIKHENLFLFTEDTGPQYPKPLPDESNPIDYFNLFIDSSLLTLMVRETNNYAEQLIKSSKTTTSRMKVWEPVTLPEMKAFIAVLLEMGITRRSTICSYWAENSRSIPWFSKMFSRNRFQLIFQCFHLVNNEECFPEGHENYDPCAKFMPIVEHANRVSKLYYKPHKELSINQSLVGTLCRSGIKFWMLCDAVSKYCLNLSFYKYAKGRTDITKLRERGLGYDIVTNLLEQSQCLNKGHHVFVNHYFSTIALAKYLFCQNTYLTGTIRSTRQGIPGYIKTPEIGETRYFRDGEVLLCGYRGNKSVKKLLLTTHALYDNSGVIKKQNEKIKPEFIDSYNRYVGGVDESDKMLYVHLDERRTVKYWKKVAFMIIVRMVLNSYLFYKEVVEKKPMTRLEFTSSIISEIENEWMQVKKHVISDDGRTFGLTKLPGRNLRRCVVCSGSNTGIKRSNLICVQCKKGLHPLCLQEHVCFKNNESRDPLQ